MKGKGYKRKSFRNVQRGTEHESRGIAFVRIRYQETYSEDIEGWEILNVIW
jgi:hypothetical protein